MAAGAEAASSGGRSGSSSGSSAVLEATLDRRLHGVTNTMESIQNLSTWCIENKKHHAVVVRSWMKWLRKSDTSHRLNLFYLANDVIQNCKRRNAIAYRGTFAEVLPEAALLVRDGKVCKSVERIFNIWKERNVYSEELIAELKTNLQKREKEKPPPSAPVNTKSALKSKIVAEFAPQAFVKRLLTYKHSEEEGEINEKQLIALKLDMSSSEALKCLKDKAGGNQFSTDFEEGSVKLQDFVKFLEGQVKTGPALLEALRNADVFYEMQYKEVKIVANAYQTFANRVSNLKRKLDALKATMPDLEESPIPSPLEDAPSPSGSETSSHGLGNAQQTKDEQDSGDKQDMDVSKDETNTDDIVENKKAKNSPSVVSSPATETLTKSPTLATPTKTTSEAATSQPAPSPTVVTPTGAAPLNLANVDLGKISSILNSITNAMKNSGVSSSPGSRPSPGTPTSLSGHAPAPKASPVSGSSAPNPLASILSKVDITPKGILNVLTKTNTHSGLSTLLSSARAGSLTSSNSATPSTAVATVTPAPATTISTTTTTSTPKTLNSSFESNKVNRNMKQERVSEWGREREKEREKEEKKVRREEAMPSLESKINSFLQGNPGFAGVCEGESNSPLIVGGDSTPVRDERGGTPTQDEMIDSPQASVMNPKPEVSPWGSQNNRKDKDYRVKNRAPEVARKRGDASPGHAPSSSSTSSKTKTDIRRGSSGSSNVGKEKIEEKEGKKKAEAVTSNSARYHRIQTVVTATTADDAKPVETLSYSNRIQTVEGIRVTSRSSRRSSGASWYEEAEFMEVPPLPHHGNHAAESSGDLTAPPAHLQQQYPPPPLSPFFSSQAPPLPMVTPSHVAPPTPPPIPSRDFPPSPTTSAVMVGGILVPIDRILPHPPQSLLSDIPGGLIHRGGAPSATLPSIGNSPSLNLFHPPLLGQNPALSSPTTPTTPTSREARPLLPSPSRPLLRLPSPTHHLPLPLPIPRESLLHGTKRPGSAYRGGLLHTPKRPYLPPRY